MVKSLNENNEIIETIEYHNTKNALRNIKGFPALVAEFYIREFTYELPNYNFIESIHDFRFIDNIKTRDYPGGYYNLYKYDDDKGNSYDGDYPTKIFVFDKSHNDPTLSDHLWYLNTYRHYIKEE